MKRREFLKFGAGATALGISVGEPVQSASVKVSVQESAPAVLASYTGAEHRKRLENIARSQQAIRGCLRKHLIGSYLPGHCCYNLGEYPARKIWNPDEWDERELDALHSQGIRLIQVHEEWNDSQRLFGGHKLTGRNAAVCRHGSSPRDEDSGLCLQRLFRPQGSRLPPGMGYPARPARDLFPICPLLTGQPRMARVFPAACAANP
jgi:hypothetical protein